MSIRFCLWHPVAYHADLSHFAGKLQQLLSCEMEVRRQLQEMDMAEALLLEQRRVRLTGFTVAAQ